jgi:hypothetical protein
MKCPIEISLQSNRMVVFAKARNQIHFSLFAFSQTVAFDFFSSSLKK